MVETKPVGPEAFMDVDEMVIGYKGDNFYKSCDAWVYTLPDGTRTHCVKRLNHQGYVHEDYSGITRVPNGFSNIVDKAHNELSLIGEDAYTVRGYLHMLAIFAEMGHSGGSASAFIPTLHELLLQKNLSPLTDNPNEWIYQGASTYGNTDGVWQNKRSFACFSENGGKTYYDIDEPLDEHGLRKIYASKVTNLNG